MTLHVSMTDLYGNGNARFNIDVQEITTDAIKQAIEDNYYEVRKQLQRIAAGKIRVSCKGINAEGSIAWWWDGTHSIRIDHLHQDATSVDAGASKSVYPLGSRTRARNSPTCCALVRPSHDGKLVR